MTRHAQEMIGKPNRPKRVPLAEQRNKLTVNDQDPDFVYRWVNDVDDRIEKFKRAGYEIEEKKNVKVGDSLVDNGQATTTSIVEKAVGGRVKALLMRQRKEDYAEDQAKKQKEVDALEAAMKREATDKSDYGKFEVDRKRSK